MIFGRDTGGRKVSQKGILNPLQGRSSSRNSKNNINNPSEETERSNSHGSRRRRGSLHRLLCYHHHQHQHALRLAPDIPTYTFIITLVLSAALIGCTGDDSIIKPVDLTPIQTSKLTSCGPNQFLCADQLKCIDKSQECDLSIECYDSSDEHANCPQVSCKNGTFTCKLSKRCIPLGWACDGTSDCGFTEGAILDNSDEICHEENVCQPNFHKCDDGITCIKLVDVCNGLPDCPDASDEAEFCRSTSLCANASHCKYGCRPSRNATEPVCYCPIGQEFNGTDCVDSNECNITGACDQICIPGNRGKKNCQCVSGYTKKGSHCFAQNVPPDAETLILYQDATGIKWMHLNGSDVSTHRGYKSPPNSGVLGVDFDHLQDSVCWINHDQTLSVMRCSNNSKNLNEYYDKPQPYLYSFKDVYKMAFDWISQNYYFVDDAREMIFLCRGDLKTCRSVIDTDLSKPRGLAIDPTAGYMFFTVWGASKTGLDRALMDGSERTSLVMKKIVYPYGITVDIPTQHVYWVDKFLDSVERVDYDGNNRRTIYRGIQHLQDITVFENMLYLVSWKKNQIISMKKFETMSNKTIKENDKRPLEIMIYHRQRQPRTKPHPCFAFHSHSCQEFCFPFYHANKTGFAKCGCKEGEILQKDGKTCASSEKSNFMIYSKQKTGIMKSFSLRDNIDKNLDIIIPVVNKSQHLAFDYDARSQVLYYSDRENFKIMKKGLWDTKEEVYMDKGVSFVEGMAVDWMGKNLFWTDENLNTIYVASLKNPKHKKLLVHANLTSPKSILVDPMNGYVYWSNFAKSLERDGSIERMWMDGTHREYLVKNLGWPIGLTMDYENGLLYYSDALEYSLERIRVSGTRLKKEILYTAKNTTQGHPNDLAFFNGTIYMSVNGEIKKTEVFPSPVSDWPRHLDWKPVISHEIAKIRVFDGSLQDGSNKCSGDQVCPQLCLTIPISPFSVCACQDGYEMTSNGQTCKKISNYTYPLACDASEFECRKFPKCIIDKAVCDGSDDCGDGSDEDTGPEGKCLSTSTSGPCGRNYFHCGQGVCISSQLVCDDKADCENGKDESPSSCPSASRECSEHEFTCQHSKRCIPKSWQCDGETDCGDNDSSDEEDCVFAECSPFHFQCANKTCIPLENLCDGNPDCPMKEDENNCGPSFCARLKMFHCETDNKCINMSQKCDGLCQCSDGEDELDCDGKTPPLCARNFRDFRCESELSLIMTRNECINISCGADNFRCHDGSQCIPREFRCDGVPDCQDRSDEANCPKQSVECHYPNRLCDSGQKCVLSRQLCDGHYDCIDKSDEGKKCEEDPCGHDKVANCSHSCQKTPEGHICYCPSNMHLLQSDKSTCVDDHPCDQWGTCSQGCKKIGKRYECFCLPDYALKEDNFTCKSKHPDIPYLVFSNRHELREINLHNPSSFNSLISNLRNSIALDFYHQEKTYQILWTDVVDDRIYKGSLNGGSLINIDIVIQTGLATAEGLAVDWIGENLYWVESNLDQIEVAKLNGSFRKTLISGEMFSPRSIALDPQQGILFWTDWEADAPRIERASMSGDYRKIVFKVGQMGEGAWPNGLTLDYTKNRIYWVDARLDSIHTIKYDGSDFRTILSDHEALSHPFAITVFESNVYWTDWRSNSVMRANKFTGGNVTTIQKTYTQPFDVKIFHPSRQPRNIKNPCGGNNGGCSHLCLLNINQTFACGCPHLMALGPDNKTCVPNEKMLLFSRLNEIRAVYLDKPYYHAAPPISYPLIVSPANLHFVAKYKQIYWCDAQSGETKRANISNPPIDTLIDGAAGKPLAIGVDWISNLIFIAVQNPLRNSISVTNLNGEYFTTIIYGKQDLKNINSIAVNPHKAQIYWPEGNSKSQFSIQMAQMDGSKRTAFTTSRDNSNLEHPVSLSYDFTSDRLYWVNYNTERIQYYDFKSNRVQTISFGNLKPNVITVYHDYVYFASEKQDAILKGDKTQGGEYEYVRNNTENIYSIRVYDPDEQNGTNSCSVNNGGCQHLCLPVSGTKKVCKCALGYAPLSEDPTKCKGLDTVIVYVDSSGIKGVSPEKKSNDDLLVPIPLVSFATDIDVDENNEYLYWLDNDKGRISRIKRDGTGRETVLKDLEAAIGLAIDWNAGNMYWANPKDSMIEVAHVNGSSHYVLITENLDKPMSIAVDPTKGYLFWSDISKGVIERSRLDGSDRKIVVNSEPLRVADIALDMENERIYWCDSANDKIESATYDGGSRMKVLSGTAKSHLHSPLIDKGILYWIDMGHQGGSIMSTPVNNIDQTAAVHIRDNLGVTMKDLGVFSTGRQKGSNPCGKENGGCQDLCLFNGTHPVCICAHGKIGPDGKSCRPYDAFLAFSRVSSIETIHISEEVTPNAPYPAISSSEHIRNAIGLAFDFNHQRLFYSDVQLGTVNSVYFNGTNFSVIAEKQGSVEGLYFEAAHSDLYWTCSNDASINRINPYLSTAKVEKILKLSQNDKPRGIVVDPCDSRIYWTNWDMNKPSIQRAYMSGYGVESIITTEIRMPNGLTLDHGAKKLYWVDARLDKIERCELDGSGRTIIASEKPKHAFSIAVFGEYIYWSDWVLHSVMRADKYSGSNVQTLRTDILKPMGIVAVSKQPEECLENACQIMNGGCAEVCNLNEYGKPVCKCGAGRVLTDNGRCVVEPKNRANCTQNEFRCTSGSCIDYELTCDGTSHCPDGSDEEDRYCASRKCKEGFFQCPSNRCIKESKRCDGDIDCQDNSDELNCTCKAEEFQCVSDGQCIEKGKRCNKNPDCVDASDEMNCGRVECPKNISESSVLMEFYQCAHTTACIHKSWECDGQNDCWDNSDEKDCPDLNVKAKKECHPNSFTCEDGSCILNAWTCDMDLDCESGEDEKNCQYTCKPQQFVCGSGECISSMWRCDNSADCSDGSDEGEHCNARNCDDEKQFKCNSTGRCIPKEYVCDGDEDCPNGEDEQPPDGCGNVTNSQVPGVCSPHQFQCKNGICLSPEWICDNENDCAEGEDEENCPGGVVCDENACHCPYGYTLGPDGRHCVDLDECATPANNCKFMCKNLIGSFACICPEGYQQIGDDDCRDINECSVEGGLCQNGRCVNTPGSYRCECYGEGWEPSHDYSKCLDRRQGFCFRQLINGQCITRNTSSALTRTTKAECCCSLGVAFGNRCERCPQPGTPAYKELCMEADIDECAILPDLCKHGSCINTLGSYRCICNRGWKADASQTQCLDVNECDLTPKVCQHSCENTVGSFVCTCPAGFKALPNNPNMCTDIDECEERTCSQKCRNTLGSYKCSCNPNYILKEDGKSCKANSSEPVKLLLSNQYYIRMLDNHGSMTLLAKNLSNAVALDYDWDGGCIYFSDVTPFGSSIKRLCIDSKRSADIKSEDQLREETLHLITVQSPDGLAVDWVGKNLYWCDKGTDTIEVSRLDGSYRKVLIHERLQEPRGIALDPLNGQLFWTDWGEEPYIGRAGMDGSNFKILISENLGWPNALTISHDTNELFWADAKEDYIAVSDFNGGKRKTIHSRGMYHNVHNPTATIHHIFSITTFEDSLWWSDWETKSVERCHKYTGKNETRVTTTIQRPMDVKAFHPFRQPPRYPNPCENRGGCQTLCLLSPGGGAVCACPENFVLTENQKNCTNNCTSSQFECKATLKCIPSWWVCDGQNDCSSDDNSDEPADCPPFNCTPGQYQCQTSGECIHPTSLCDAKKDCADGSDEKDCDKHTCFGTQFKCEGNGTVNSFCIPQNQRCDGRSDCPGGQDEMNCQSKTCPANQFTCQNKKCIQPEWTCDMEDDCGDNSDESPAINCSQRSCDTTTKFRCRSGKCIPQSWRCDGEKDCHQGEDEPASCANPEEHSCEPSYFRCDNHKCIPSRWRCDYDNDCQDNSDELNCKPRNCSESEWRCDDGRCIRNNLRCNGEYSCDDKSDEQNCNTTCTPQNFVCVNPRFCIHEGWRCDGDRDCLDGSDEENCENKTGCHIDQFRCANGECISSSWKCDAELDCADGSDEEPEMCKNTACEPGKFRCRSNNICIPYSKTCDGIENCEDGSDEQMGMCPQTKRIICQKDQFQCENSHKCINASLVCDNYNDCIDNSDELDCVPCTFGSCSHTCVVKKTSGTQKHNFSCECADGYKMAYDGSRSYCQAIGENAFMLLATENQVLKTNPNKPLIEEAELLMTDTAFHSKVESLDYLMDTQVISVFYTTGTRRSIQELKIPNGGPSNSLSRLEKRDAMMPSVVDVVTGLDQPRGIAIDWVAKRIYWLDSGHRTLSVSSLDGNARMALISKGLVEPFEIVVDPESGRMYWSDWSDQRIGVAFMDGSGKKTLVQSPCPMGLAIDYPARRLYWTDIKSHSLETITLDGRDRRVVKRFKGGDMKPNRIDVFEDWVYLTSYHTHKIYKMDKFGREEPTQWLQGASDTLIVHSQKKKQLNNPCDSMICPSPGLCLLSGNNTASCVCPNGKGQRSSFNKTHQIYTCKSLAPEKCDLKCKQGQCVIEHGKPKCVCNPLYEGTLCEVYRCSGYCMNKGMCYQDLMAIIEDGAQVPLKCDCPPDFTGERCETQVVSCRNLCNNNGKCNETSNTCTCQLGYTGRFCEACEMLRCENGGICKLEKSKPFCQCPKGFGGYRCDKSNCEGYCLNKGKCRIKNGSAECSCMTGFKGKRCEVDVCAHMSCMNGGKCESTQYGFTCNCPRPFVGVRCEHNLCECQKCSKTDSKCLCPPHINAPEEYCYGANDSLSVKCKSSFCKHGGSCLVFDDKPYCRCLDSWIGTRCEISAPQDKPCQAYCLNGGICIMPNLTQERECKCFPGWTGPRCQLKANCGPSYCFNGGTCVPNADETLLPSCSCPPGYYGIRCGSKIKSNSESSTGEESSGITWVLVLVFIVVAMSVAGLSGCMAYVVMRRKQYGFNRGRPFMHVRMHDAGTVEINNPMFLKEEGDEDHASEPSLIFDSDKVLLQGTNFANPVYETMYKEGESSTTNDEKKGLLQGEDFSSSRDHPLADIGTA